MKQLFTVLFFLSLFVIYIPCFSMEETKIICTAKSTAEIVDKKIEAHLHFENIDATIQNVAKILNDSEPSVPFFINQQFPQWKEVTTQKRIPDTCKAVGSTVAWISKEKPHMCRYSNKKLFPKESGKRTRRVKLDKPIELFDISPNAKKIIITAGNYCQIWHAKKHRKINEFSMDPYDSTNKTLITTVQFADYESFIVGLDNGHHRLCSSKKKQEHFDFNVSLAEESPVHLIDVIDNNHFLAQYGNGSVICHTRKSHNRFGISQYPIPKGLPPFTSMLLLAGIKGWIAQDRKKAIHCFNRPSNFNISFYTLNKFGTLVGKTSEETVIIFAESIDGLSKLINYSLSRAETVNEVSLLRNTKPVLQKLYLPNSSLKVEDWLPNFLMYQGVDRTNRWTLLKKQSPSSEQLAFKILLAKAWNARNHAAVNELLQHEIFRSFGNYTQKLLKEIYSPAKL